MPSPEEKLVEYLSDKNKKLSCQNHALKQQLADALEKLCFADAMVHEFELALMSGGVTASTLLKLKGQAKAKKLYGRV